MSVISVYDVNNFLKADATVVSIAGKQMSFFPVVATDNEAAPFVVYFYNPVIPDVERYWHRCDFIKYSILDTNVDRLFQLSERFIEVLGRGDQIAQSGGIGGTDVRILCTHQLGSNLVAPLEVNGWYRMNLDFKICFVAR